MTVGFKASVEMAKDTVIGSDVTVVEGTSLQERGREEQPGSKSNHAKSRDALASLCEWLTRQRRGTLRGHRPMRGQSGGRTLRALTYRQRASH